MKISRKVSWLVSLSAFIVLLPALFVFYHIAKKELLNNELTHLSHQIQLVSDSFTSEIGVGPKNLKRLGELINRAIPDKAEEDLTRFDQRMMISEDGIWRNKREHYNGRQEPGLYLPSEPNVSDEQKMFYGSMLEIFEGFGTSSTNKRTLTNVWYLGHDRSELIFDLSYPDFIYLMSAEDDYTSTEWMTLASPENNPDRGVRWTPTLFDPVSETWMVSTVYPLDMDGEWVGTMGHDMQLKLLFDLLENITDKFSGEQHMLRDHRGNFILAGPWQKQLEAQLEKFSIPENETDLIATLEQPITPTAKVLDEIWMDNKNYQVISLQIKPMNWTYLNLVPTDEITAPLTDVVLRIAVVLIATVLFISLLIQASTRKIITLPIQNLVERTRQLASGNRPSQSNNWGSEELSELSHAVDVMYDDLEHEAERLLDSETRYKNVVNNIREVLVQINLHHQWHFLSPAWLVLTGYEVDKSLNQSINSFFHHHDQAKLIQQVENLFAGKAADWTGEIRLVNTKQHVLWVRLSLQVISDKDANFIVGTIENIHIHHLTNESNEVLRMTEQMVVSSDSAIFPLLDYVTTKMAKALDVSLLWIYISDPSDKSELFKAGDLVDFLYEKTKIWDGLLASDSPVTDSLQSHDSIRLSEHSTTVDHWRARLEAHQIKDSIIIPLQLRHDYVGIIGVHSDLEDVFNAPFQQLLNNFSAGLRVVCHLSVEQQLMRLHRAAVETSANAIMITDSNRVIEWVNHAFEVLTEYHLNDIAGKTPHILTTADDANEISTEIWNSISQANVWQGELTIQCKSGSVITVHETITPLLNHQGKITHYISIIQNITEAKANQERIEFLATHDKLTSLPNRSLLNDRMETAIAHSKRHNSMFAVLFIDLDQFKVINDSFGHQFGDQLIQKVADRISAELRMDDTVARFGGDEFVIILSEVHDEKDISHVAEKLLFVIKQGYYIKGHEINISASIGISVFPNDADSAEVLLQSADSAMYQSKELGRNAYRFYTKELHEKVLRKHQIEEALRKAVAEEQFVLYYQPKIDLKTKRIMGAECLIRWQHPEMGIVSPLEFIPLAEETGMILNIGTWVLEQSCQQMHRWSTQYDWFKSLSINLSARQFQQEDFITDIKSIFTQTKVDPQKIDLEITESLLMDNIEDAIRTLACLQAIGASISIDDFGTGYSSLSYLKRLPANTLKIDRSFVKELGHGDENEAIIRSILALADNLQLDVVAEGIEEEAQDAILTEMGCQYAQGYLFSKPLSLEEFNQLLEETNSKSPS